jgi:hypothetical protein
MNHATRIFMLGYLIGFALVETQTAIFRTYPPLMWIGLIGVLAVLVRAARCARHYWTEIREEGVEFALT